MRWPDIFFKSRKSGAAAPPRDVPSKLPAKLPTISELAKSVEPFPAKAAADKTADESLRALTQSGSLSIGPRMERKSPEAAAMPGDVPKAAGSATTASPSGMSFRQRAKLVDIAPVPAKDVETPDGSEKPFSQAGQSPAAVVPAAFSVEVPAGSVMEKQATIAERSGSFPEPETARDGRTEAAVPPPVASDKKDDAPPMDAKPVDAPAPPAHATPAPAPETKVDVSSPPLKATTRVTLPESVTASARTETPTAALEPVKATHDSRDKREFVLANGERILGHILSESADTIYLDHHTLGVLTLPRTQIAKKPIEVILINGDRIVGDLIAETSECLYVRHASLGMLTVPHNQRSTRVVEAILKDGDRILGEVLAETDHFTVIRSATLGTVAVQHEQVAMLNRKIEQMPLRSLPAPALEDAQENR